MHTIALILAAFLTLLLAGPALLRGGLIRSWVLTIASIVPVGILYLAFRGDGDVWFLWPAFILLSITAVKSATVLLNLHAHTPVSHSNVAADGRPHWAV
ncbi:hypothetical protein ACFQNE_02770 [Gordonia phosphorivorans]|uniref:Uncharacterized protein n=1 Tax=Gordonia phosphorivorans TaxID=1056982 RepID=A0ABV6H4A5_9ACTN